MPQPTPLRAGAPKGRAMGNPSPDFELTLATEPALIAAAQRLRYDVFVTELGGSGPGVDHEARRETDRFDAYAEHLLLIDRRVSENLGVVGCYRLLSPQGAQGAGGFYCASEFDLGPLLQGTANVLELGRSCLHPAYRGGTAMFELWSGLSRLIAEREVATLFGVASFPGTDLELLAEPLSFLHHNHLAPPPIRVRARGAQARSMNLLAAAQIDRRRALSHVPALIKGYLRLGGAVGEGAWVDTAFNTVDVCMVVDLARVSPRYRAIYSGAQAGA